MIFKVILVIGVCEIALRWLLLELADDKSTLVQVMAWCYQATSYYLSQCWLRSLSPYGITRTEWVNVCKHYVFLWSMKWGVLTHWGWDKMTTIFQTTFSIAFSSMKMCEFRLRFHWNLFLSVKLTIFQHWFRWWLGADQGTSHYLNQWWLVHGRIYMRHSASMS